MLPWILSLKTPALVLYVFWCIGISSFALSSFAKIIQEYLAIQYDYSSEALMVMGQVGFQWLFMAKCSWLERKVYALIAITVSMIGSLLLLPLIAYNQIFTVSALEVTAYFFVVVGIIFVVHHLFLTRQKLPIFLTFTWVVYRLLLLIYVVFPRGDCPMTSLSFSPANRLSSNSNNTLAALKTAPLQTKFSELNIRLQALYDHRLPAFKLSDFFKEAGMNKSDIVSYFKLHASPTHKATPHPHARGIFDQMLVDFILEQPNPEEFLSHLLQDATTQDVGQFILGTLNVYMDEKKNKRLDVSHFGYEPLNQVFMQNNSAASFERLKKFLEEHLDENGNLVNKRLQRDLWKAGKTPV